MQWIDHKFRFLLEYIPVLDQFLVSGIEKLMKIQNDTKLPVNDSFGMNLVRYFDWALVIISFSLNFSHKWVPIN